MCRKENRDGKLNDNTSRSRRPSHSENGTQINFTDTDITESLVNIIKVGISIEKNRKYYSNAHWLVTGAAEYCTYVKYIAKVCRGDG